MNKNQRSLIKLFLSNFVRSGALKKESLSMVAAIRERVSWVLMAILAIVIIVIGFEGSLGKVLGCIFTPGLMIVGSETAGGGTPVAPIPQNPYSKGQVHPPQS